LSPHVDILADSGYQGIAKIHANSQTPLKKKKNIPLTKEQKRQNQILSSKRITNQNVIGTLKKFKIIADKYRNRRKRFSLRFNLISGIYNYELP